MNLIIHESVIPHVTEFQRSRYQCQRHSSKSQIFHSSVAFEVMPVGLYFYFSYLLTVYSTLLYSFTTNIRLSFSPFAYHPFSDHLLSTLFLSYTLPGESVLLLVLMVLRTKRWKRWTKGDRLPVFFSHLFKRDSSRFLDFMFPFLSRRIVATMLV